jgi:hypothetical protein
MTATGPYELAVEALTMAGRAVSIMFRVRRDTIEVFESSARTGNETNLAMLNRDTLTRWLAEPTEPLVSYDLTLEIDYHVDNENGRLAITTKDVLLWTLSPQEEHRFNKHLGHSGVEQWDSSSVG